MSSSSWRSFLGACCAVILFSVPASAQVCGDADGNGQVSVTDGVQALRAAAALTNTCTAARCDVDGNGSISVTDGVNILRKAAALPITESCPNTEAQIEELLGNTLGIFGTLTKVGGAADAAGSDNFCENPEGQAFFDEEFNEIVFVDCNLGGLRYDGTLGLDETGSSLAFDLDFVDLATGDSLSVFGDLSGRAVGDNTVFAGALDVSLNDSEEVSVVFDDVIADIEGNFVGGALNFDATDSGIEGVVSIRVGFEASSILPVTVIFADQRELNFEFDTFTGELTPVSN